MNNKKNIPLFNQLPLTRIKLLTARILYRLIHIFVRNNNRRICRNGIYYDIDLSEGIDFSLFLFGYFQSHVLNFNLISLPADSIVLDVGANIGTMSLQLAKRVSRGKIFAFEPTDYALKRLKRNLSLNLDIANRIIPIKTFLSDRSGSRPQMRAYSSWKIDKKRTDSHIVHGGSLQNTTGVEAVTIDDFCKRNNIKRVDFIKIDTDGYEYRVLQGGRDTIERFHPYVIFEVGLYLLDEQGISFEYFLEYFSSLRYKLVSSKNRKVVSKDNYCKQIPLYSTIEILALPLSE